MPGKVAFLYATFPRPTETFVRRELRGLGELGFDPDAHSIWKGDAEWHGKQIKRFRLVRLWSLFFWIPFWLFLLDLSLALAFGCSLWSLLSVLISAVAFDCSSWLLILSF